MLDSTDAKLSNIGAEVLNFELELCLYFVICFVVFQYRVVIVRYRAKEFRKIGFALAGVLNERG